MDVVRGWFKRQLANPQIVSLTLILVGMTLLVSYFGAILAPVLAATVLAYLLEGPVSQCERIGLHRTLATMVIWCGFFSAFFVVVFALVPLISRQAAQVVQELPILVATTREYLQALPEKYPQMFTVAQIDDVIAEISGSVTDLRQSIVARTWILGVGLMYVAIYLVLVPLLVFFMLKDKGRILGWSRRFLPREISLVNRVWQTVDLQLGNYVRGKFTEILIVGTATFVTFYWLELNYAPLLAVLVGVSVLVPYIGATVVTLPVAAVAFAQHGLNADFGYVMLAYGVIQLIDGNILVPVLFSEAVDLHPVAIIVAVLFFGGVWGFWGVFFAIPLATVVQAVLTAWPEAHRRHGEEQAAAIDPEDSDAEALDATGL